MKILLTFDVEVWCNSWDRIESDFPRCYERYVFGNTKKGAYALPKTLEIMDRYGLRGVFFVEPLFATRFGIEYFAQIVDLIQSAGHEIQLHLHPEWVDEAKNPLLSDVSSKRPYLFQYSLSDQEALINHAIKLFRQVGLKRPTAFRSGSFSCNEDTFSAVQANGLIFDSSINRTLCTSKPGIIQPETAGFCTPFLLDKVQVYPMTIFKDGFGQLRHAQVGACSLKELIDAIESALSIGWQTFLVLSHNFELLIPGQSKPDRIVTKRFDGLCRFLHNNRDTLHTVGFDDLAPLQPTPTLPLPRARASSTAIRYVEQAIRRLNLHQ